jgi:hypothetical protein
MSRRRRFKPLLVTAWFDGTSGVLGQVLAEELVAVSVPMRQAVRHHPRRQLDEILIFSVVAAHARQRPLPADHAWPSFR